MAKDAEARVVEREEFAAVSVKGEGNSGRATDSEKTDGGGLSEALDTLDEKIKLLLARHSLLAERFASVMTARREAEQQLARLSTGELDPVSLEERMRELEAENERLSRHAAYLEDRIASLLARVRYVVES
jgi:prefoldin subunit 5